MTKEQAMRAYNARHLPIVRLRRDDPARAWQAFVNVLVLEGEVSPARARIWANPFQA